METQGSSSGNLFLFPSSQHLDMYPMESIVWCLRVDKRDKNSILVHRKYIYFLKTAAIVKLSLSVLSKHG